MRMPTVAQPELRGATSRASVHWKVDTPPAWLQVAPEDVELPSATPQVVRETVGATAAGKVRSTRDVLTHEHAQPTEDTGTYTRAH